MAEEKLAPIIVIKKKSAHAGSHGGAWKVAYADFVTAMMALFIVLWLLSSSETTKKAVGGYFNDPKGYGKQMGSTMAGSGETLSVSKTEMGQIKQMMEEALKKAPEFQALKEHIQITVTGEGLRIELLESEKGIFFQSGKSAPSEFGIDLLQRLAVELGKLPNRVLIEGHTDSAPFVGQEYSNWELSSDRANAARRLMQDSGLRADQVTEVRGFADQRLRNGVDSTDASNRRISVIVQYAMADHSRPPGGAPVAESKEGKEKPEGVKAEGHKAEGHKAEGQKPSPAKALVPKGEAAKAAGHKAVSDKTSNVNPKSAKPAPVKQDGHKAEATRKPTPKRTKS